MELRKIIEMFKKYQADEEACKVRGKERDAQELKDLAVLIDLVSSVKNELAKTLLSLYGKKMEVYFPEDERKVIFSTGNDKYEIDISGLSKVLTYPEFLSVASVTETNLKKFIPKEKDPEAANKTGEVLVSKFKKLVAKADPKKDKVEVYKITKAELKEHAKS